MATFTLTIADNDLQRVLAALSIAGGFTVVSDVNAKACVVNYIATTVANVEAAEARRVAAPSLPPVGLS